MMLKADKIDLRRELMNGSSRSDGDLARAYECSIGTVRKYRRAVADVKERRA